MKKQAIIFDVDGLLVDTERYYTSSWQQCLQQRGYVLSDEETKQLSGFNWRMVRQKLIDKYHDEALADHIVQDREALLASYIDKGMIEAKPYALDILEWAKQQGYRLAIASSGKKARAKRIVTTLGILDYMEYSVFGDDVAHNKPAPDAYLDVIQHLQLPKEAIVAVEDSITGATAATKAGLDVIVIPDSSLHQSGYSSERLKDIQVYTTGRDLRCVKEVLEGE